MDNGDLQLYATPCDSVQNLQKRPFKAWVLGSNPSELTTPWPRYAPEIS